MPQVGPAEILVILLVGLLVFGPKRLPEIGRQVGRAMREVKKIQETVKGELDGVLHLHEDDDASPPAYSPSEPSITVPDATPALPPPAGAPPVEPGPAPHAQSRFRAPGGTSPDRPVSNGSAANGSAHGSAARNGAARPGARPPSRFRAPGPRPTT